jgi:hypothetical protein
VNDRPVPLVLVVEALAMVAVPVVLVLVNEAPFAERLVVLALVVVRLPMNPLVKVRPVPVVLVVEALVMYELVE